MFGLEFLKRIVKKSDAPPPGTLVPIVKISDYVTHFPNDGMPRSGYASEASTPVKKSVRQAIIDFITDKGVGREFSANQLRAYVNRYASPAPGSTDRILRDLRRAGVIGYVVVNRQKSLYEVTPPGITIPDATGDSEPYFNKEAIEVEEIVDGSEASTYEEDEADALGIDLYETHAWEDEGGLVVDEGD